MYANITQAAWNKIWTPREIDENDSGVQLHMSFDLLPDGLSHFHPVYYDKKFLQNLKANTPFMAFKKLPEPSEQASHIKLYSYKPSEPL